MGGEEQCYRLSDGRGKGGEKRVRWKGEEMGCGMGRTWQWDGITVVEEDGNVLQNGTEQSGRGGKGGTECGRLKRYKRHKL